MIQLPASARYALRGGFLLRPFAIALSLGFLGAALSTLEERTPAIGAVVPQLLFPARDDPAVGQAILTSIATSVMTVVSIVFAMLLMTLTLASTQFSPRILVSFTRDKVTQWTLGVFLGTFCYCIAALPSTHSLPHPFVPVLTLTVAMLLAPVCVGHLVYLIHHISVSISVNTIIDRIRRETELVIDGLMPEPWRAPRSPIETGSAAAPLDCTITSRETGYIRYIHIERLRELAKAHRLRVHLGRRVGHFVPEGVELMRASRGGRLTDAAIEAFLAAVDVGPTRTMQQDIEFGIVQIVDIALKALSPAINDPTTAITCVDQLSAILIRWLGRTPAPSHFYDPPNVLRVVVPWVEFPGLFDLAFEQIRHYSVADAAVSLRLIRALCDIASTVVDPHVRAVLRQRGRLIVEACGANLQNVDMERLRQRLEMLEAGVAETD